MCACGSNIQYLMLYFHKEKVPQKNKCQEILPAFMLAYSVNLYSFVAWCIYGYYSRYDISDFPILFSTSAWLQFRTFMLELLCIYFRWYIFVGAGEISNFLCQLILISRTFQWTITNKNYWHNLCYHYVYLSQVH